MARREEREYREYATDEQRSQTPGPPTRQPRWGGDGMHRRPNANELLRRDTRLFVEDQLTMGFLVFTPIALIVLRLTVRWRWRTVLLASVVVGLVADVIVDLLVTRSN